MDLACDQIKLEAEMEKTINSDLDIETKITTIKMLLSRMTAIVASLIKFTSMTNNNPI